MKKHFSLEGRNIVITGASSGIGRRCAINCSEMGASVILVARDLNKLNDTLQQMTKGNHSVYSLDITEYQKVASLISEVVTNSGKIYGFIHSAGLEVTLPIRNTGPEVYQKIFATNVYAGFQFARILSNKKYLSDQGGSYVFISSVMGMVGEPGKVAYSSSKGAVIAGVKAMALELVSRKIRVNSISPAMVETEMAAELFKNISEESKNKILELHPLGIGKPEDIGLACVYLLSGAAKWVTGTNLVVDGGYSAK